MFYLFIKQLKLYAIVLIELSNVKTATASKEHSINIQKKTLDTHLSGINSRICSLNECYCNKICDKWLSKKEDVEQWKKPQKLTGKSKLDALCGMPSQHYQRFRFDPKKVTNLKYWRFINKKFRKTTNFSLVYMYTA